MRFPLLRSAVVGLTLITLTGCQSNGWGWSNWKWGRKTEYSHASTTPPDVQPNIGTLPSTGVAPGTVGQRYPQYGGSSQSGDAAGNYGQGNYGQDDYGRGASTSGGYGRGGTSEGYPETPTSYAPNNQPGADRYGAGSAAGDRYGVESYGANSNAGAGSGGMSAQSGPYDDAGAYDASGYGDQYDTARNGASRGRDYAPDAAGADRYSSDANDYGSGSGDRLGDAGAARTADARSRTGYDDLGSAYGTGGAYPEGDASTGEGYGAGGRAASRSTDRSGRATDPFADPASSPYRDTTEVDLNDEGYRPGTSSYEPGNTGFAPRGTAPYRSPAGSYQSPRGTATDPHYRPGGTSDYAPTTGRGSSSSRGSDGSMRTGSTVRPTDLDSPRSAARGSRDTESAGVDRYGRRNDEASAEDAYAPARTRNPYADTNADSR